MASVKMYDDNVVDEWVVGNLEVNKKGGKSCYIYTSNNEKVSPKIQLAKESEQPLRSPFGLNSYDEAQTDRKNFEFSITNQELESFFKKVDEFALRTAKENSEKWFKKSLSDVEIASMYKPCLTENDRGYPSTVRSKVTLRNGTVTKIWKVKQSSENNIEYVEGSSDDLNRHNKYIPIVAVAGIFFMQRLFGVSLTCTDVMVFEAPKTSFPFIVDREFKQSTEDETMSVAMS